MISPPQPLLPIHGFVLAGGKSSRMGTDKALLPFQGRPMVELAVDKLRHCCAETSIAGNRSDLCGFAPIVEEEWIAVGPAGGMYSGLRAAGLAWAMFLPVDVPLLPTFLLRRWAEMVLARETQGVRLSILRAAAQRQPAISLVHKDCLQPFGAAVREGVYKLGAIYERVSDALSSSLCVVDAEALSTNAHSAADPVEAWFRNVNTPAELAEAEAWAAQAEVSK